MWHLREEEEPKLLTADDLIFTYQIMMHPKTITSLKVRYEFIKGATKIDDSTVQFELKRPVWKHSFKEGFLIPITEIIASKIPFILGGAVVVEQVFNWPGMGRMAWQAAQDRDFPLIMGITIVAALFVRSGSLLQRTVYIMVNPRASQE